MIALVYDKYPSILFLFPCPSYTPLSHDFHFAIQNRRYIYVELGFVITGLVVCNIS